MIIEICVARGTTLIQIPALRCYSLKNKGCLDYWINRVAKLAMSVFFNSLPLIATTHNYVSFASLKM